MKKEKAWVWFKGGLSGGYWASGFISSHSEEGGIIIEKNDFITCRVPEWRVTNKEPQDINKSPMIPNNATWKYN